MQSLFFVVLCPDDIQECLGENSSNMTADFIWINKSSFTSLEWCLVVNFRWEELLPFPRQHKQLETSKSIGRFCLHFPAVSLVKMRHSWHAEGPSHSHFLSWERPLGYLPITWPDESKKDCQNSLCQEPGPERKDNKLLGESRGLIYSLGAALKMTQRSWYEWKSSV